MASRTETSPKEAGKKVRIQSAHEVPAAHSIGASSRTQPS